MPTPEMHTGAGILHMDDADAIPTMLVRRELDYLTRLAQDCTGSGRLVELGCFLGGSSAALLTGLDRSGSPYQPILSYDAFEIPMKNDERFALWLGQYGLEPGERFRSKFDRFISRWSDKVVVREGWVPDSARGDQLLELYPEQEPIELLFCDIAKTWGVHLSMLRAFGSHLHPGSTLVQQDFFDLQTPWIPLHMWQLREVLIPRDALHPTPTCSFRCESPIAALLPTLWDETVDPSTIEQAWDSIIAYWTEIIGSDAAQVFHGHAFQLAIMQDRIGDAVRHGRAYEAWSRSAHCEHTYFSPCWHDLLDTIAESLTSNDAETHELRALIAESVVRGSRVDRPRPGQRVSYCPESTRMTIWDGVDERLAAGQADRVVLYGAGQHTHWLLQHRSSDIAPRIDLILDDEPSVDELLGIPVCPTDAFVPGADERVLILPSSDSYEGVMRSRLAVRFGEQQNITIGRVYTHEDAGELMQTRWRYVVEAVPESKRGGVHDRSLIFPHIEPEQPHRAELGLGRTRPWLSEMQALFKPPAWCRDYIRLHECAFVWDFIEAVRPDRTVEIGTASGVSSAMMLHAIDRFCDDDAILLSFDIATRCYFDPSRPLAAAIGEMAPGLIDRAHTYSYTDAADAASVFRHGEVDLLMIDGEHANPAPVVDLISLLYALKPNAWVLLHDVELEHIDNGEHDDDGRHSGAGRLFRGWPFEKLQLIGEHPHDRNIGAIRMPEPPHDALPVLLEMLIGPWESNSKGVRLAQAARKVLDAR
ncbi:MAG: class I SAM-dependent methyltransferase [Phycisphaerales bacterium JB052]